MFGFSTKQKVRGWYLICTPLSEELDDKSFVVTLLNGMIAKTQQTDGVEITCLYTEVGREQT